MKKFMGKPALAFGREHDKIGPMPTFLNQYRYTLLGAAIVIILILGAGGYYYLHRHPHALEPLPAVTEFQSGNFSFTYPIFADAKEYTSGVVSVGGDYNGIFIPLVDVVHYRNDPQSALPANLTAFITHQAEALCGGDAAGESISCADPVVTDYTSPGGLAGELVSLTLIRTNVSTGTTTSSTFAPIYVFDPTISPASADEPMSYSADFIYPTFSSYLATGTTSPELVGDIVSSFAVTH